MIGPTGLTKKGFCFILSALMTFHPQWFQATAALGLMLWSHCNCSKLSRMRLQQLIACSLLLYNFLYTSWIYYILWNSSMLQLHFNGLSMKTIIVWYIRHGTRESIYDGARLIDGCLVRLVSSSDIYPHFCPKETQSLDRHGHLLQRFVTTFATKCIFDVIRIGSGIR